MALAMLHLMGKEGVGEPHGDVRGVSHQFLLTATSMYIYQDRYTHACRGTDQFYFSQQLIA